MFRSLFDPNSAFFRGMERVWTLVVLNVLWVLCSLPVVTIGPSTAALYQVLGKVIQGEDSHTARKFFAAWRENFKCALLVWLPMLAVLVLCGFDLYFAALNDRFLWKLLAGFALPLGGRLSALLAGTAIGIGRLAPGVMALFVLFAGVVLFLLE